MGFIFGKIIVIFFSSLFLALVKRIHDEAFTDIFPLSYLLGFFIWDSGKKGLRKPNINLCTYLDLCWWALIKRPKSLWFNLNTEEYHVAWGDSWPTTLEAVSERPIHSFSSHRTRLSEELPLKLLQITRLFGVVQFSINFNSMGASSSHGEKGSGLFICITRAQIWSRFWRST